jgi:hypothetical protein
LRWVERNFGHAVAKAYAGHADNHSDGATSIYTRAGLEEVAYALSVLTGESHPLVPGHQPDTHVPSARGSHRDEGFS